MAESTSSKFRRLNDSIDSFDGLVHSIFSGEHSGRKRLISKEGYVNIQRSNITNHGRYLKDLFTSLLDLPWIWILFLFVFCFVTSWVLFGALWYLLMTINGDFSKKSSNITANDHIPCVTGVKSFRGALLYSIETQQTIGYGTRAVTENCIAGIFVLIIQSCFGLIIQALCVGLVYTKLSCPKKRRQTLIWSRQAVIALRDGFLTFQCRLGDMRQRSTLVEAHIRMYFIYQRQTIENEVIPLDLYDMNVGYERGKDRLLFNWPIIIEHRIDCRSPLYQINKERISKEKFEILIILEGITEPTGMITQARTSYIPEEIFWGGRFATMIGFHQEHYTVDYSKFSSISKDTWTTDLSAKQIQEQKDNDQNN